ncbi:hypothetical protein FA531_28545, partial [Pseudomonas aeruginosa]|nr:hypothetical protein [Pseudomonas aeruginosa]
MPGQPATAWLSDASLHLVTAFAWPRRPRNRLQRISPHFSQPCALGRFDGRRSSQVAQAADSADFGQAPASALEQGA